jgi:hypothetical protein
MRIQALTTLETMTGNPREFSMEEQEYSFGLLRGRAEVLDALYMRGYGFVVLLVCVWCVWSDKLSRSEVCMYGQGNHSGTGIIHRSGSH